MRELLLNVIYSTILLIAMLVIVKLQSNVIVLTKRIQVIESFQTKDSIGKVIFLQEVKLKNLSASYDALYKDYNRILKKKK